MKEKTITIRLPEEEYKAFDAVCEEKGYSKTGKIRELIRNVIKEELESVRISAKEWELIKSGIREKKIGDYVSHKELKYEIVETDTEDTENP